MVDAIWQGERMRAVRMILVGVALQIFLGMSSVIGDSATIGLSDLSSKGRGELGKLPIPDFTKGDKAHQNHDWNLGPTGLRGWMWGMQLRTDLARQILVTEVEKKSPADGKILVGDVILGVSGTGKAEPFSSDARVVFGKAITEAEKIKNKGRLSLLVWRKGKTVNLSLRLKVMGTYSKSFPKSCSKSRVILARSAEAIAREGLKKGIPGMVNAMALLATGERKHLPLVRDYIRTLKVKDARGMSSWNMGYMNILISEYYLLTKDRSVLSKIKEMARYLAGGQSPVGTWGHGNVLPSGVLAGYGAMCNPSLVVAISLVMNQKCGIKDASLENAIRRSEVFFSNYVDCGNIPYGDHSPRDVHDSNGRCSLAVILYHLLGNEEAYRYYSRMTIASFSQREEGHTGNYWSFLWGPLGAMRSGQEASTAFFNELSWFFDLERRWDGSFRYQGGAGMTGSEHTTPGWDTTGARALMYAMSKKKLFLTGRGLEVAEPLRGAELESTMKAGRGYSTWASRGLVKKESLDDLSCEALLKELVTWSTPYRIRVAKALSRKKGESVPELIELLKSGNREKILGGVYGLEQLGGKAEPAIDLLVDLLAHEDRWVRFRAGAALCAIGAPAREKAVPILLKSALETSETDPREMHQRYISFVLWGGGHNGEPRGLIARDLNGVDRSLLVPAIKKIIRNTDGQTRMLVSKPIRLMKVEELKPLWDDLLWAVEHPSPSGIMFNGEIREVGMEILSSHRLKEGIPVIASYIGSMKQHGSQKRIYRVMDMLKSYGAAAKSELKTLKTTVQYYEKNLGPGKMLEFPVWARDLFMKGLTEGIESIEKSTATPKDLRSIKDL